MSFKVGSKDRRIEELEALARDLWTAHDCGAECAMFNRCQWPVKDECPMEERMRALGLEV